MCRPEIPPHAMLERAIMLATWQPPTRRDGKRASGLLLWRGESPIDGAPIALVLTFKTTNRKTGPLVQTWILRCDVAPHVAQRTGDDESVCGGCKFRPINGETGVCYVATFQGPRAVFEAMIAGLYPMASELDRAAVRDRYRLRAGAYGDPGMVPAEVWASVGVWTGYTHQWRRDDVQDLRACLMASADSVADAREAWARGWRTFRVGDEPIEGSEIYCPNVTRGVSCFDCGLCGGNQTPTARSIVIPAHGARVTSDRLVALKRLGKR